MEQKTQHYLKYHFKLVPSHQSQIFCFCLSIRVFKGSIFTRHLPEDVVSRTWQFRVHEVESL